MLNIEQLPIPDWGLHCPACGAQLAGMREHRCACCGQHFNVRDLLARQKPVPDFGFTCEECGYLLRGLPENRCPECGTEFSVREMLDDLSDPVGGYLQDASDPPDHYLKRSEPTFTGRERPVPDFGLCCHDCEWPLVGASDNSCPHCGSPFDLLAIVPRGDWLKINAFIPMSIQSIASTVLYEAAVPYMLDNAGLTRIYGGKIPFLPGTLRIPREFFFDALHALAGAAEQMTVEDGPEWTCNDCNELVPAGFDVCWHCGSSRPDSGLGENAVSEPSESPDPPSDLL